MVHPPTIRTLRPRRSAPCGPDSSRGSGRSRERSPGLASQMAGVLFPALCRATPNADAAGGQPEAVCSEAGVDQSGKLAHGSNKSSFVRFGVRGEPESFIKSRQPRVLVLWTRALGQEARKQPSRTDSGRPPSRRAVTMLMTVSRSHRASGTPTPTLPRPMRPELLGPPPGAAGQS